MFLLKLRELTLIISKACIYYDDYNNTKYFFIASYRDAISTNNIKYQSIQQNLIKCIKVQNELTTKGTRKRYN